MTPQELRERERLINTIIFCGMVGLILALAVATAMVYEESSADDLQPRRLATDTLR